MTTKGIAGSLRKRMLLRAVSSNWKPMTALLLMVTVGGLYLLHLDVLANVLVLGSAVLLARLDLVRIQVIPPPALMAAITIHPPT